MTQWLLTYGSYIIGPLGLPGVYFIGSYKWWAWAYLTFVEICWIGFGLFTNQYGFIIGSSIYILLYIYNFYKWRTSWNQWRIV